MSYIEMTPEDLKKTCWQAIRSVRQYRVARARAYALDSVKFSNSLRRLFRMKEITAKEAAAQCRRDPSSFGDSFGYYCARLSLDERYRKAWAFLRAIRHSTTPTMKVSVKDLSRLQGYDYE